MMKHGSGVSLGDAKIWYSWKNIDVLE